MEEVLVDENVEADRTREPQREGQLDDGHHRRRGEAPPAFFVAFIRHRGGSNVPDFEVVPTVEVDVEFRCDKTARLTQHEVQAPVDAAHLQGVSEVHNAREVDEKLTAGLIMHDMVIDKVGGKLTQ